MAAKLWPRVVSTYFDATAPLTHSAYRTPLSDTSSASGVEILNCNSTSLGVAIGHVSEDEGDVDIVDLAKARIGK